MSFRKELKYKLSNVNLQILKSSLFEDGMKFIYPKRKVTSCYFDTNNLDLFHESINGILPRYKFRIRSYDDKDIFYKETKITSIEGRFKTSNKISKEKAFYYMQNGISIKGYGNIKSKLEISYMRDYYIYRNCRLTFDYKISYLNKSRFKQMPLLDDLNVMELKTSINQDNSFLERLFPFQSTSFSKYVRVISKTNFVY
jgi:hypothetical protein